jgi:DNA-binding NtrC family response regulator
MSNVRVLVLDDEEYICENLAAYFEDEGFEVIKAGSAEEALEMLSETPVDVGVVDIRLPGIDGELFIRKAHKLLPVMRFVIHTGSPSFNLSQSVIEMGIGREDVIRKPVSDMGVLARAVRRLMDDGDD